MENESKQNKTPKTKNQKQTMENKQAKNLAYPYIAIIFGQRKD